MSEFLENNVYSEFLVSQGGRQSLSSGVSAMPTESLTRDQEIVILFGRDGVSATPTEPLTIGQEINILFGRDKDYVAPPPMDLWATWWLFLEPGMDDIYEKSGTYLDKWLKKKELAVVHIDDKDYIFLGRFEWRNYGRQFVHTDGVIKKQDANNVAMFVDFMSGLSWDAIELLASVRDSSMGSDQFEILKAKNDPAAPIPKSLFEGYEEKTIYWNYLWMTPKEVEKFSDDHAGSLKGEDDTKNLHDWFRVNILMDDKFPIPGEFMGLAVRIFPEYPWGQQGSNPFIFSGNFMDTAYKMRGQITSVVESSATRPYKLYKVKTHLNKGAEITICATDFEDYNVDDFVTIIKDVAAVENADVFNWKDLEKTVVDEDKWMILPTTYYDTDEQET